MSDANVVWAEARLEALANRPEVRGTDIQTEVLFIRSLLVQVQAETVAWRALDGGVHTFDPGTGGLPAV